MSSSREGWRAALRSAWAWVLTIGGSGLVTTVTSVLSQAAPAALGGIALSSAMIVMSGYALYREHHPPERDERLREFHREKIQRWRKWVNEWQRGHGEIGGDDAVFYEETPEYAELLDQMEESEKQKLEEAGGWRNEAEVVRRVVARLEREWDLV